MNILITHVYSVANNGDAAILRVLISEIKKRVPEAKIEILSLGDSNLDGSIKFDNIPVYPSVMWWLYYLNNSKLKKFVRLLRLIYTSTFFLCANYFGKRSSVLKSKDILSIVLMKYANADLVIAVGGGYLRGKNTIADTFNVAILLHSLLLGKLIGKRVILHSQSIGPFGNVIQSLLTAYVLKKMDLIQVREDKTIDILKNIGVLKKIVRSVDAGFLLKTRLDFKKNILPASSNSKQVVVGITVREWMSSLLQQKYEKSLSKFIENLVEKENYYVVIIPQVTSMLHQDDDRVPGKRIFNYLNNKNNVLFLNSPLNLDEIVSIYSNMDFLVGTRFHSVIFSLINYVPCLAIEYEHKTSGILNDLGLKDWMIKIEDVTYESLTSKFDQLVKSRHEYLSKLKSRLPLYIEQAEHDMDVINKLCYE